MGDHDCRVRRAGRCQVTGGMVPVASFLLGAVVGLICVAIFAINLRGLATKKAKDAIKLLTALVGTVLGGGAANYLAFRQILSTSGAMVFYLIGLSVLFLPFGISELLKWLRVQDLPAPASRALLGDKGEKTLSK